MTTIREIEEAIEKFERSEFGRRGGFWNEFMFMGVVDIEIGHIQSQETNEPDSGNASIIFSFSSPSEDTRYFKKIGYRDSWDGSSWDGPVVEVERQEVIKYEWRVKR